MVILAVGILRIDDILFRLVNIPTSLALFITGAVILRNLYGVRKRSWLVTSPVLQTALNFAAAAVQYQYGLGKTYSIATMVMDLLAFANGMQMAMVRSLKITDVTTAMGIAAYADIFVDAKVLCRNHKGRDRRLLFLLSCLL